MGEQAGCFESVELHLVLNPRLAQQALSPGRPSGGAGRVKPLALNPPGRRGVRPQSWKAGIPYAKTINVLARPGRYACRRSEAAAPGRVRRAHRHRHPRTRRTGCSPDPPTAGLPCPEQVNRPNEAGRCGIEAVNVVRVVIEPCGQGELGMCGGVRMPAISARSTCPGLRQKQRHGGERGVTRSPRRQPGREERSHRYPSVHRAGALRRAAVLSPGGR